MGDVHRYKSPPNIFVSSKLSPLTPADAECRLVDENVICSAVGFGAVSQSKSRTARRSSVKRSTLPQTERLPLLNYDSGQNIRSENIASPISTGGPALLEEDENETRGGSTSDNSCEDEKHAVIDKPIIPANFAARTSVGSISQLDGPTHKVSASNCLSEVVCGNGKHLEKYDEVLSPELLPTIIYRPRNRPRCPVQLYTHTNNNLLTRDSPTSFGDKVSSALLQPTSHVPKTVPLTASGLTRESSFKYFPETVDNFKSHHPPHPLPHAIDSALAHVTIKTVELASMTKILIESQFRAMLKGEDRGTQRQRRLDRLMKHLSSQPKFIEGSDIAIDSQKHQETKLLRQQRIQLLQEAIVASGKGNPCLEGFEVIKVLGKGSFGVVRLVRVNHKHVKTTAGCSVSYDMKADSVTQRVRSTITRTQTRRARPEKEVFAMKVIKKSEMLRNGQEGHIKAERDFLVRSEGSRWVVTLYSSFQDQDHLYLVMDFMIGGDFLGFLIRLDRLSEAHAKFYLAEMILAVQETHNLRWIHRDVKPDNFLISASGHLKISDFGLAFDGDWTHNQDYYRFTRSTLLDRLGIKVKGDLDDKLESVRRKSRHVRDRLRGPLFPESPREATQAPRVRLNWSDSNESPLLQRDRIAKRRLAHSIVGTSQYMAPEIVRGADYDGRCDWWSIGVILYECLYGRTPFLGESRYETKQNVLWHRETLRFYPGEQHKISSAARDLIRQLLQEPEHRLTRRSYARVDVERMLAHNGNGRQQIEATRATWDPCHYGNTNYLGYFVARNDAEDIKQHPFFNGIDWDHIHVCRPPHIPRVKDNADTRYFERNLSCSDMTESEDSEEIDEEALLSQEAFEQGIVERYRQDMKSASPATGQGRSQNSLRSRMLQSTHSVTAILQSVQPATRRARDKILRDRRVGRLALQYRKRGAFLGYAYRRPLMVLTDLAGRGSRG